MAKSEIAGKTRTTNPAHTHRNAHRASTKCTRNTQRYRGHPPHPPNTHLGNLPARCRILLEQLHQQLLLVRERVVEKLANLVGVKLLAANVLLAAQHAVEIVNLLANLAGANLGLLNHRLERFGLALRSLFELFEIVAQLLGLLGRNLVTLREGQRLRLLLDACENMYLYIGRGVCENERVGPEQSKRVGRESTVKKR
jgi:hypothetical protein